LLAPSEVRTVSAISFNPFISVFITADYASVFALLKPKTPKDIIRKLIAIGPIIHKIIPVSARPFFNDLTPNIPKLNPIIPIKIPRNGIKDKNPRIKEATTNPFLSFGGGVSFFGDCCGVEGCSGCCGGPGWKATAAIKNLFIQIKISSF
jgi:hypothetical protein